MFGFGRKPLSETDILLVAIRAAVLIHVTEQEKNHVLIENETSEIVNHAFTERNFKPTKKEFSLASMSTTALATEKHFIETILNRMLAGDNSVDNEDLLKAKKAMKAVVQDFLEEVSGA